MSGGYNGHRGWGGGVNRGRGPQAPNLAFQLARQLDAFTQQQGHVQLKGRGEPKLAVPVVRVLLGEREGPGGNRKERELEDQAKARSILKVVSKFKDCFSGGKPCQLGEEGAAVQISYISTSTQARELGEAWVNKGFEAQGVKYTAMYDLGTRAPGTRKVVVTGLPPNYAMEGVIEVLLQASGYATGPSMVVETFLGAMSIGGVPQELPRFDIIVSFVRAPPEDPMLRQLPTGFKTLDGQQVWVQVEGRNLGEEFGFGPDPWQVGEADVRGAGGGCGAHPLGPMPTPPPPPPHTQQQQQQQQQPLPPPGQPNRAGQRAAPWHGVQFGSGVRRAQPPPPPQQQQQPLHTPPPPDSGVGQSSSAGQEAAPEYGFHWGSGVSRATWQLQQMRQVLQQQQQRLQQQQQSPPTDMGVGLLGSAGQGGTSLQGMQGGGRMGAGTPAGLPTVTTAAAAAGGPDVSMASGSPAQGWDGGLLPTPSAAAGPHSRMPPPLVGGEGTPEMLGPDHIEPLAWGMFQPLGPSPAELRERDRERAERVAGHRGSGGQQAPRQAHEQQQFGPIYMEVEGFLGKFERWRHDSELSAALCEALREVIDDGEDVLRETLWAFIQAHKHMGMGKRSALWRKCPHNALPNFARDWVAQLQPEVGSPYGSEGGEDEGPSGDPCSSSGAGRGMQTAAGADTPTAVEPSPASEAGSDRSRGRSQSRRQRRGGRGGAGRGGGRGGGGRGSASRDAEGGSVEDEGSPAAAAAAAGARLQGGGRGDQAGPSSPRQRTRSSSRVKCRPIHYWQGVTGTRSAPSSPQGSRGRRT